jgi:hypothetical protein
MGLALIFLWMAVEKDSTSGLIVSYLFLVPGFLSLNSPIYSGSNELSGGRISHGDLNWSILSFIVLTTSLRITVDGEIFADEIGQAILVILPLMIILSFGTIVRHPQNIMISGSAGTMIIIYGTSQSLLDLLPGTLNYPMLWVLGGFMIYATGFFLNLPPKQRYIQFLSTDFWVRGDGNMVREEPVDGGVPIQPTAEIGQFDTLIVSTGWGFGLFIFLTLIAIQSDLTSEGILALLQILWAVLGLLLLLLGTIPGTRERVSDILISSMILLVGALFFYAAGVFFSVGKYVEGLVEILVGVLIIQFGLSFLSTDRWHLVYTCLVVAVGVLSVHQLYINL